MKKEVIKQAVDQYLPELVKITDEIYDLAEPGMEEVRSAGLLNDYLKKMGSGRKRDRRTSKPHFGLFMTGTGEDHLLAFLAEYDALKDIGHACDTICRGHL